ncbi:MAG: Maf family protein [Alphaproteobacteria bacterium]|nr:Maf family protein [Alphaproteobacteria bacterium]
MPHAAPPRLILASASTARLALLHGAGLAVEAHPAHVDEAEIKAAAQADGVGPDDAALLIAELKAARIARREPDALVIAADQLLIAGEEWFDKPPNLNTARAQLLALRGRAHTLVTAVLCQRGGARIWHHVARPSLTMRDFSDEFLDAYLTAEGDALTACVGAYRLEGMGVQLFDRIEGDYFSILGLPLLPLLGFLRQHGALPG